MISDQIPVFQNVLFDILRQTLPMNHQTFILANSTLILKILNRDIFHNLQRIFRAVAVIDQNRDFGQNVMVPKVIRL